MPKLGARLRAGEHEWNRQLSEEAQARKGIKKIKGVLIKDKEETASKLSRLLSYLKRWESQYKTPENIPKERLQKIAGDIYNLIRELRIYIAELIKKDLISEKNLGKIFGIIGLSSQQVRNRDMITNIKKREKAILKELYDITNYWGYISASGKLPQKILGFGLGKYNNKPISHPFEKVAQQEILLLKQISEIKL